MCKNLFCFLCLALCLVLLAGCGREASYERSRIFMDTVVTLRAAGPGARAAVEEGMVRMGELERMLGTGEGSDARRLGEAAGRGYVRVSPETMHVLEASQRYSELTGGAWDVTAAPLVALWGIGTENARVPTEAEQDAARRLVGWQGLKLRPEEGSAMLVREGMGIHLGGVAKGYAADEVRRIFERHGVQDGLISMGTSTIYAMGKNEEGAAWRIGLRHPRQEGEVLAVVPVSGEALSTSGDYERYFERDGVRYCHIMDPRAGRPARGGLSAVTVVVDGSIEDAGMVSDVLSTAVFVLGAEEGRRLIESLPEGISCRVADAEGNVTALGGK